ncbi:MAG: hypothetical protein Q4B57_02985 [Eubacteriales bacterium]|nr:hypothetical protein [Eubacteriales bacterium]
MVNQILEMPGYMGGPIDWKSDTRAIITMFLPVLWQYEGFYFVIITTELNNISRDPYEVAEHTYVSRWHLSKLLNRHMQQSFSEQKITGLVKNEKTGYLNHINFCYPRGNSNSGRDRG